MHHTALKFYCVCCEPNCSSYPQGGTVFTSRAAAESYVGVGGGGGGDDVLLFCV